jgi:putative flippase GtrA
MNKIKELYKKYRELINYAIFGGATTVVNMVAYYFLMLIPFFSTDIGITIRGEKYKIGYLIANAIAFVVAVIFSYIMNRQFVFGNKVTSAKAVIRQFFSFFITRLLSFVIEEILLFSLVEHIGVSEYIAKWPVAVFVVVINYAFGKLLVFRKRDENGRIIK